MSARLTPAQKRLVLNIARLKDERMYWNPTGYGSQWSTLPFSARRPNTLICCIRKRVVLQHGAYYTLSKRWRTHFTDAELVLWELTQ